MANPNPTYKYKRLHPEPLADTMTSVRLPVHLHEWVRSLPNKADWLRDVIADAHEKEIAAQKSEEINANN